MAESIGTLVPSQIPTLSDVADIQEAFRLYHYGAPSGTNVGEYDPSNANVSNLPTQSIASYINQLNVKVAALEATPGVQPSQWNAKGALVTATANSTVSTLPVGANGTVLVATSSALNGLEWQVPSVTLDNTVSLVNKTINLGFNTLIGTAAQFNTALSDDNFATIAGTETLTNKTLTSPTVNSPVVSGLYLSDSAVTFEGTTADDFETVLTGGNPTADREIVLPDVSGTVLTTGNLSSITSTGTLSSLSVTGNVVYHVDLVLVSANVGAVSLWDGRFIVVDASTATTVSLPDTATVSFPIGTQFTVFQKGTGQVEIIPSNANVSVLASPGRKLRARYSSCTITKLSDPTNPIQEWAVIGDLVA